MQFSRVLLHLVVVDRFDVLQLVVQLLLLLLMLHFQLLVRVFVEL